MKRRETLDGREKGETPQVRAWAPGRKMDADKKHSDVVN